MSSEATEMEQGELLELARKQTEKAIESGVVLTFEKTTSVVDDNGMEFLVVHVPALARKPTLKQSKTDPEEAQEESGPAEVRKRVDPFSPHHPDAWVCDISETHKVLLNKYAVSALHMLVVTIQDASQWAALEPSDLASTMACVEAANGLAYFNGGPQSGASQPHRHLQVIPLPLSEQMDELPVWRQVEAAQEEKATEAGECFTLPAYRGFHHQCMLLHPQSDGEALHVAYSTLLQQLEEDVGKQAYPEGQQTHESLSYNLLFDTRFMLIVARSRDEWEGFGLNSVAFAGTMLAKTAEEQQRIVELGPLQIMAGVTVPTQ